MESNYYEKPARFSDKEWKARVRLAAVYRIFAYMGWDEAIYNHISLRVPGEGDHFLINPFGLHYSEVCASNLVKVDLNGEIVGHSDWPISPAGFTFHSAIHEHRGDTGQCVMHVHTTATSAVSCLEEGISYTNFYSAQLYGKVAYHDFEGMAVYRDENMRFLESAGDCPILMLHNHGPIVIGSTLAETFSLMWVINRACDIQVAMSGMGPVREIPKQVLQKCVKDAKSFAPKHGAGEDVLAAFIRIVEKQDSSFKM